MACCSLLRLERLLGVLRTSLGKTTGLGFGRLLHTMILRREVQEESRTRNFFGVTVRFWFLYFFCIRMDSQKGAVYITVHVVVHGAVHVAVCCIWKQES